MPFRHLQVFLVAQILEIGGTHPCGHALDGILTDQVQAEAFARQIETAVSFIYNQPFSPDMIIDVYKRQGSPTQRIV